jgi:hypothetical protein
VTAVPAAPEADVRELERRAAAFGLFALGLSSAPERLAEPGVFAALWKAVEALADHDVLAELAHVEPALSTGRLDRAALDRIFALGRVAPYEASCSPASIGGHTAKLADVSGFYRAFGFHVTGERPDHVTAELEFTCWLLAAEAAARRAGDNDRAEVCDEARSAFVRDHLGGWLDELADQIAAREPTSPVGRLVRAAARFVEAEASRQGVEIVAVPVVRPWDDVDGPTPGNAIPDGSGDVGGDELPRCPGCDH